VSTIKSSAENLTLNADGANNDVIIQSNASTKVTVDGALGNVGIAVAPEAWNSSYKALQLSSTNSALYATTRRTGLAEGALKNATGNWQFQGTGDKAGLYEIDDSTVTHKFYVSNGTGSTGGTITFLTGFEVLNDGKARAKNGLLFGTDTAAANTLDDYEEGTWTVTVNNLGGTQPTIYEGTYNKIGSLVTCSFALLFPTQSDTSSVSINLPFAVGSLTGTAHAQGGYITTNGKNSGNPMLLAVRGAQYALIYDGTTQEDYQTWSNKACYGTLIYNTL